MTKLATIWQPLVRHWSVLLGALLIGVVWITLSFFLANERNSAERAAIQNSTNPLPEPWQATFPIRWARSIVR